MHLVGSLLVVALVTPFAVAGPRGGRFFRRTGDATVSDKDKDQTTSYPSKDDKTSTTVLAKDQTASSSVPAKGLPPTISVGIPYGTSFSSAPESTQEIVVTDVVYTTLTTCPVTSTVTSGNSTIEKVTTTISTVTLTSTSTICTKCVAPPKSKPEIPSTSGDETVFSSLPSSIVYPLTQPSYSLLLPSLTSSKADTSSSGGPPAIVYSLTLPKAPLTTAPAVGASSNPETAIFGTAPSSSKAAVFPSSVSLTVPATSVLSIPGYSIVPSPTSVPEGPGPFSNDTSSIIPVYSTALLGNAYGGGFVLTPSIYVTKLPSPSGPSEGVPPGYGFTSTPETLAAITSEFSATIVEVVSSSGILESIPVSFPTNTMAAGNGTGIAPSELSATIVEVVSSSGVLGTIPVSFPTNTITTGNGTDIVPSVTVSKDSASKASSNIVTALGATVTAASNAELSQTSIAVLVSQGVTIVPASSINAVPSTSGLPSGVEQSATPVVPRLSSPAIVSPASNGGASIPVSTLVVVASSQGAVPIGSVGTTEASGIAIATPGAPVSLESRITALANAPTTGTVESVPGSLVIVAGVPLISATELPEEQTPTPAQSAATILTPIVGANGLTSLVFIPKTNALTSPAVPPTPVGAGNSLPSPAGAVTSVLGVNGLTSLAGIPSPVVGANGLTSLAVFSTPIAANGLTSPAVILTPVVGANGLASLAVLAIPVVGANGLTSLAIGLASEQGATAAQPNGTPAPIEESILIASPATPSASQFIIPAPPVVLPPGASNLILPSGSAFASFGNASVHVLLNPTAIAEFQGSAVRLSLGCGMGLMGFLLFLRLL
ncbi:hypothetical protein OEA41_004598 [Lepraria neglecta]|uniref:Uncharacterized protein n=1 Tax=Lepraria neglecta TaxID=209136 RepID=A0AAD9Z0K7_9LECA|nr:hypothetical protein OEA41_004598 [Lepraria neglecta]